MLLAEDTPANQKVVTSILKKRGHQIDVANNGREAVDAIKRGEFDLVIMDVQMPTMDGFQATAVIRSLEHTDRPRLPIIAMTAHAMRGDRERCLAAGMDAYLAKPVDARKLIELVESFAPTAADADEKRRGGQPDGVDGASANQRQGVSPPDRPVFDLEVSLARLDGDRELFANMAQFFAEDSPGLLDSVRGALQAGDAETAERAAHSLKGLAANFSAEDAVQSAFQVERAAKAGKLQSAAASLGQLEREVQRLRKALQPFLHS